MTLIDMLHSLLALFICGGVFALGVAEWPEPEKRVAMYCWYAHAVGAFAVMAVYEFYYDGGDITGYFAHGRFFAQYVEYDPVAHLPQLFEVLLQRETNIAMDVASMGSSTASMAAVGGLVSLLTTSAWAGSVVMSTLSAGGQACLWLGMRTLVPAHRQQQALWSMMMVPSVVFWSSSLFKEAMALQGMGLVVLGLARLRALQTVSGGVLVALGVYMIGLFKAYVLFPLALSIGVYAYWYRAASRGGIRFRPIVLVIGAGVTIVLLAVLGAVFPRYSVANVTESIEQNQRSSLSTPGGSDYRQSSPDQGPRGVAGMIADAPFTIVTALLRPFVFESRSAMMLINSVEMTVILYFVILAFVRTGRVELLRWVWRSPDIIASLAFVLLFSFAVGLATTNLGTLSRYRLPMMPFYIYVVAAAQALPATRRDARRRRAAARAPSTTEQLVEGA